MTSKSEAHPKYQSWVKPSKCSVPGNLNFLGLSRDYLLPYLVNMLRGLRVDTVASSRQEGLAVATSVVGATPTISPASKTGLKGVTVGIATACSHS